MEWLFIFIPANLWDVRHSIIFVNIWLFENCDFQSATYKQNNTKYTTRWATIKNISKLQENIF